MIVCPRCQMQNVDGSFQCSRCGYPFVQRQQMQSAAYYYRNNKGQYPSPNNLSAPNAQYQNPNNGFVPNNSIPQGQQSVYPNNYNDHSNLQKMPNTTEHKNNKKNGVLVIIAILLFLITNIAVYFLITQIILPSNRYNSAIAMMNRGEYENAVASFEAMGDYKDSRQKIIDCQNLIKDRQYDLAIQTMNDGDYEAAIESFTTMENYKDSRQMIIDCQKLIKDRQYDLAIQTMNDGDYEAAIVMFTDLKGYRDSNVQIEACKDGIKETEYYFAVSLMNAGNYPESIISFEQLGDYKDSSEKIKECQYLNAIKDVENGNYVEAYTAFSALGDYKDSKSKQDSIWEDYKKILLISAEIGDIVYFGNYEQDNLKRNGTEPIGWIVLDKSAGKILLLSQKPLDMVQWQTDQSTVHPWSSSYIRDWLNNDFYNSAFSNEEKKLIVKNQTTADINPEYTDQGYSRQGLDTEDNVFLLSIKEVNNYLKSKELLDCSPTTFAKAKDVNYSGCDWMLRTRGDAVGVAYVHWIFNVETAINYKGWKVDLRLYIRPSIWIKE